MSRGKSIRIFLSDGSVTGIRHAEVVNWTGQAIFSPRKKVNELVNWSEANRPGVYFLFGEDENTLKQKVYIGEAENVLKRLQSHLISKEYWNEVIFFTNKDENLTKGHIKYLESRLILLATSYKRYVIDNSNSPQLSSLPRGDIDSMEEFIDNIRLLLGTLGHKLLEPLVSIPKSQEIHKDNFDKTKKEIKDKKILEPELKLYLSINNIDATSINTNEGIVVLAGSKASKENKDSLAYFWRDLKDDLISQKILITHNDYYEFTEDYLFKSPTAAACIIAGYSVNGRIYWKDESGKTIKELEQIATD